MSGVDHCIIGELGVQPSDRYYLVLPRAVLHIHPTDRSLEEDVTGEEHAVHGLADTPLGMAGAE
jgi:hypothetical protein